VSAPALASARSSVTLPEILPVAPLASVTMPPGAIEPALHTSEPPELIVTLPLPASVPPEICSALLMTEALASVSVPPLCRSSALLAVRLFALAAPLITIGSPATVITTLSASVGATLKVQFVALVQRLSPASPSQANVGAAPRVKNVPLGVAPCANGSLIVPKLPVSAAEVTTVCESVAIGM
jgi:hypothetical protein